MVLLTTLGNAPGLICGTPPFDATNVTSDDLGTPVRSQSKPYNWHVVTFTMGANSSETVPSIAKA
jgi:hypothetical protein